jgi:hypothetical protein
MIDLKNLPLFDTGRFLPNIIIVEEAYFRYLTLNYPHGNVPWRRTKLEKLRSLKAQGLIRQLRFRIKSNGPWCIEVIFSDLGKRIANRLHSDKEFEPFPEV